MNRIGVTTCVAVLMLASVASTTAEEPAVRRSLQVDLPGQEHNAIKTSWPAIGCWFWTAEEFQPDGYKRFLDLHAKHSPFKLLTTSIRHPVEVTDPKVHDQIKAAAIYARQRDMAMVMDLDVRLARQAFMDKHPDELQEIVRLREVALTEAGDASIAVEPVNLGDHYTFRARGYDSVAARVLRVYSYTAEAQGIEPESVRDITGRVKVLQADAKGVKATVPCTAEDRGRTACVLAAFTLFTPDVFAPHLVEFERNVLRQYADAPLAGACKDEWGFPGRFGPRPSDMYFSRAMAEAYAKRRPGRDLVRDMLLMIKGEKGRAGERAAAINHWMEMSWQRNGEVETAYYRSIKEVFGPAAMSATHPTWYPSPNREEVFKNGLDWWAATRDLAQTDETTPYCVRTALAKKWRSPLWYNMYYSGALKDYEAELWGNVLSGWRTNYHPLWPSDWRTLTTRLLSLGGKLLRAECRVQLLNYISTAPIDCPVAVVFGHPRACNWADAGCGDPGLPACNALWAQGYYADLIPSSEIACGALKVSDDGHVQYGPQKYAAVLFYQPQYERPLVGEFFRKAAAAGTTALYRVGDWTMDFEGGPVDVKTLLPAEMKAADADACTSEIITRLKASGVDPQTKGTRQRSGQCRLLDGTVILASGEKDVLGDPIRKTIKVGGQDVTFDAVGVAAVRLDKDGRLEALAAGALKSFRGGGVTIELLEPIDVALWRDARAQMHGVVQGWSGPIPAALSNITSDWQRLAVPQPLTD